jgi:hypothetical protein
MSQLSLISLFHFFPTAVTGASIKQSKLRFGILRENRSGEGESEIDVRPIVDINLNLTLIALANKINFALAPLTITTNGGE